MNELFKKYIVWLIIFSAIILFLGIIGFKTFLVNYYHPVYILVLIFFFVITGIMHYILLKSSTMRPAKFSNYFMIATTVKLLIYLVFMSLYLYFYTMNAVPFLIVFLTGYILFSLFESVSITKQLRKKPYEL